MATGRRRAQRRINPWLVAAPVALLGAAVALFFVTRSEQASAPKPKPSEQPPFAFSPASVQFVSVDKEAVPEEGDEFAIAVTEVMSDVYDAGFVSAKRWEGGTFPAVLQRFDEKARAQAEEDLAELTLGPEFKQVRAVTPGQSALDLSFLVSKGSPVAAIARTTFRASGELRVGGELAILHEGTFYLELLDEEWRIVGYTAEGSLDTGGAEPSPGASP